MDAALRSHDLGVRLAALKLLKNDVIGNRFKKLQHLHLLPLLLELLGSAPAQPELQLQALAAVGSLAYGVDEGVRAIAAADGVAPMLAALGSGEQRVVVAAARALKLVYHVSGGGWRRLGQQQQPCMHACVCAAATLHVHACAQPCMPRAPLPFAVAAGAARAAAAAGGAAAPGASRRRRAPAGGRRGGGVCSRQLLHQPCRGAHAALTALCRAARIALLRHVTHATHVSKHQQLPADAATHALLFCCCRRWFALLLLCCCFAAAAGARRRSAWWRPAPCRRCCSCWTATFAALRCAWQD